MCKDGSGQGMLHGPRRSPEIRGTRSSQSSPPLEHWTGEPWGCPWPATPRLHSLRRARAGSTPAPHSLSPARGGLPELPPCPPPHACGATSQGVPTAPAPLGRQGGRSFGCRPAAGTRVPLSCPGGIVAHGGRITPNPGEEGGPGRLERSCGAAQGRVAQDQRCFVPPSASRSPGRCRAAVDGVLLPPYGKTQPAAPAPAAPPAAPPAPGPRRSLPGDVHMGVPGWGHATAVTSHRCLRPCTARAEPLLCQRGSAASEHGCSASPKMPSPSYFKLEQNRRGSSRARPAQLLPLGRDRGPVPARHQGSMNSPETARAGAGPRSRPPCIGGGGEEKGSKTPAMSLEGGGKLREEKGQSRSPDACGRCCKKRKSSVRPVQGRPRGVG